MKCPICNKDIKENAGAIVKTTIPLKNEISESHMCSLPDALNYIQRIHVNGNSYEIKT